MKINKITFGIILILVLNAGFVLADSYARSNPEYTGAYSSVLESFQDFDTSVCEAGQDFIIQISPMGCTPSVVRSDLLEDQDVPVFCQLSATKINPLIEVEAIESISFSGQDVSEEVGGLGFHPAQSALGVSGDLNSPVLENIGYVVVILKQQSNESAMPEYVQGNLTAKIRYDIENAYGIGKASFYLPVLSETEWNQKYKQYGFWEGRGFLKADGVYDDKATVSVYSDVTSGLFSSGSGESRKVATVTLEKGETSGMIYLPNFDYCMGGFELTLENMEAPDTRAKLDINGEIVEVKDGEEFLENRCSIRDIDNQGLVQKVSIGCKEDEGVNTFDLRIGPTITLNVGGEVKDLKIGDYVGKSNAGYVYVGFIGTKGNTGKVEDIYVRFLLNPTIYLEEGLGEGVLAEVARFDKANLDNEGNLFQKIGDAVAITGAWTERFAKYIGKGTLISNPFEYGGKGDLGEVFGYKNEGKSISIVSFSDPQDIELSKESKEYYENAMADYEKIIGSYSNEKKGSSAETFGENALYEQIKLTYFLGQKKVLIDLCDQFKKEYSGSSKSLEYCEDGYALSSTEISSQNVLLNGRIKKISLIGIYEPSKRDYSVEIFLEGAEGDCSGSQVLGHNDEACLSDSEFIKLVELEEDYAVFDISSVSESSLIKDLVKSDTLKINLNEKKSIGKNKKYQITLNEINLRKSAVVSVNPHINNAWTEADFNFKIGIEKRAIQLSPDKIKDQVEALNDFIDKWQSYSENLGTVVKAGKAACLTTAAILTAKNFIANSKGVGIARESVMRGTGGWYEKCTDLVNYGTYSSLDQCFTENGDEIEADVQTVAKIMEEQNENIKELQEDITQKNVFSEDKVDTNVFMERYSSQVIEDLPENFEGFDMAELKESLSYDTWEDAANYDLEQLRGIDRYNKILEDGEASDSLKEIASQRLSSIFSDIKVNSQDYLAGKTFSESTGLGSSTFIGSFGKVKEINIVSKKRFKDTIYFKSEFADYSSDYAFGFKDSSTRKEYLFVYDEDGVVKNTYEIVGGQLNDLETINPFNVYFKEYNEATYKNLYKNAEVNYYETSPYKGLPAIVPFDLDEGWYAATKPVLPVLGGIEPYDDSGRVTNFWLCNVGENGLEEFSSSIRDDECQLINLGISNTYVQFAGLSSEKTYSLVNKAVNAISDASRAYKSGVSSVSVGKGTIKVGSPAVTVPDIQCQDFMSPQDCQILFNVCDPVICPSSRCDFGGTYPVEDVVQTGIVGSIALCLPNAQEGIYIPVCLTGVKAGIDGLLSVLTSYKDCMQHSLETGETIGICDEIYSIYLCEFLWKQSVPLVKFAIPKIMGIALGQNVRGGGEYMGVTNAWENVEKSVDYFTQYYAQNSFEAFKSRTTEDVGGEVCKNFVSVLYPSEGSFFDALLESDSPPQFTGWFEETTYSTVTNPPVSHYKVFYHIYAGQDRGVYYQVYLKGSSGSSYYQDTSSRRIVDSGYISTGDYASETVDFTAPSGYSKMCIVVNDYEECGFQSVSTDFTINYVKEQYVASQVNQTEIETENECVSGSVSAYSLLNLNVQSGVEEVLNPELYNYGIVRVCATNNPGLGTSESRWVAVGYCGDENIKCWLDTETVEEVIKNSELESDVLEDVTQNYLDILRNEEGYLSEKEFASQVSEIKEQNASTKILSVNNILEKVFLNSEKATLLFLRGGAYGELALTFFEKVIAKDKEKTETTETCSELNGEICDKTEDCVGEITYAADGECCLGECVVDLEKFFGEEFSNEILEPPTGISSSVFEYNWGEFFSDNLYYKYSGETWYWSEDNVNWYNVLLGAIDSSLLETESDEEFEAAKQDILSYTSKFDGLSSENKEIVSSLIEKDYEEGLKILLNSIKSVETGGFFSLFGLRKPSLSIEDISFSEDIFTIDREDASPIYFKYIDNSWKLAYREESEHFDVWSDATDSSLGGTFLQGKSLTNKDFYEGAELIFGGIEEEDNLIGSTCTIPEIPSSAKSVSDAGQKVLKAAEFLEGKIVPGEKSSNCYSALEYVFLTADVTHNPTYSDKSGQEYFLSGEGKTVKIGVDKNSKGEIKFVIGSSYDNIGLTDYSKKIDLISPGDNLDIVWNSEFAHSIIFIEWIDKDKRTAKVFDWNGKSISQGQSAKDKVCTVDDFREGENYCKVYQYRTLDLSENVHPVYVIRSPIIAGTSSTKKTTSETEDSDSCWEFNEAIEEVEKIIQEIGDQKYGYSVKTKSFVDKLYECGLLTEKQYDDVRGKGGLLFLNPENTMSDVRDYLRTNSITSGQEAENGLSAD